MTPEQVELVQRSFAKVVPIADTAADLFYSRLFEIAPEVEPLFTVNMEEQGRMLMSMLATIVSGLHKPETIIPAAEALAVRHKDYGAVPEQYDQVGEALIWTLEQGLGDDFTPETREAWEIAYGVLSGVMIAAANNSVTPSFAAE